PVHFQYLVNIENVTCSLQECNHLRSKLSSPLRTRVTETFKYSDKKMPPRLNIPPITRILLLALLSQSLLSFAIRYRQWSEESDVVVPYLSLVPQLSLIYPWTFLTTTLVENNVFTLGIAGATIFYGGRYLERAWTSAEFAKFLLVTSLIPNASCFGTLVILFAVTGDMRWSLTTINGTIPLQISFLVAFSQLVPTHTVTLFRGIVSLRVPRFPLLYVLTVFFLSLTPLLSAAAFLLRGTPGSARQEAERRRALALKELDQRLNAASKPKPQAPPLVQTGPSAQIQPQPVQTPAAMLGETSYVPDREEEKGGH
ncbi:eukaryotic integral membrane protein, partial [Diplocarpon rosae]